MKKVYNLSRREVRDNRKEITNAIWISISEPYDNDSVASNEHLDKLPKLKIAIFDTSNPAMPEGPSEKIAKKIVDFLMMYPNRDVVINCAMGVSRSGAIALFCQDMLKYEWEREFKQRAVPNMFLYRLMVDYYAKQYLKDEE